MNKYTVVKVHLEEANRKILKCENVHLHALLLE
jgi:hypothetical protein